VKLTKAHKNAVQELSYCVEVYGVLPAIPFHKSWYSIISTLIPASFAGWGDIYDGGTVEYHHRRGFLGPDEIKKALKLAYKLQRPLTKRETYSLSTQKLSGWAGRLAQIGII
jgi:hypothetical protein